MIQMYDTVTVDTVPDNPQAVAGYVGGSWPTYNGLVAKFPHALHLSIAVNAGQRANCLDIEQYDATPDEAPGWVRHQFTGFHKPVLYCSASAMQAVNSAMSSGGFHRSDYLLWSAHYGVGRHVCGPGTCGYPQADGTQFTSTALGRNLDESVLNDGFFGPPPDAHHYERFATGPFKDQHGKMLNERALVQEYDSLVPHKVQHAVRLRELHGQLVFLRKRVWTVANAGVKASIAYPAGGWLPAGAHFDLKWDDQGRDFATNWHGPIQAPGAGLCVAVPSDQPFPNGFGPAYPVVRIDTGPWAGHQYYLGHTSTRVQVGQKFAFGHVLSVADQGHDWAGTTGGWCELGEWFPGQGPGPKADAHWFDHLISKPLVAGGKTPTWGLFWRGWRWQELSARTK